MSYAAKELKQMSAEQVLERLEAGPFRKPAHAWLYNVRNSTGFAPVGKRERYADALVVSCWPSNGLWVAGIEVKVTRSDWRRELADPAKAAAIQMYCDRWYVAAPADVVPLDEVPANWGLLEIRGSKVLRTKEAPTLAAETWNRGFVASVLRNVAAAQETVRRAGFDAGYGKAKAEVDHTAVAALNAKITELSQELRRAQQAERDARSLHEQLKSSVAQFEAAAGCKLGLDTWEGRHNAGKLGAAFKAAQALQGLHLPDVTARLRSAAERIDGIWKEDGNAG